MKKILIALLISGGIFSFSIFAQPVSKTPQAAANALYKAWQMKNRRSALRVADREAVKKLFGTRRLMMKFKGCTVREEGGYECIYQDVKNDVDMAMIVEGGASAGGWNVTSLSFSTEAY